MCIRTFFFPTLLLLNFVTFQTIILGSDTPTTQEYISNEDLDFTTLTTETTDTLRSKVLHWYIAIGGCIGTAIAHALPLCFKDFYVLNYQKDAPILTPEFQEIINTTLYECNLNPENITAIGMSDKALQQFNESPAVALGNSTLLINPEEFKEKPNEARFVIGHEAMHLKYNHNLKLAVAALCVPIITHFGLKAWNGLVAKTITSIQSALGLKKDGCTSQALNTINNANNWLSTFCLTKAIIAIHMYFAVSRYFEKEADTNAVKLLGCKEDAITFFRHIQETIKAKNYPEFIANQEGDLLIDFAHPLTSKRIEYIEAL